MATVNLSSIITPANIVTASGTETLINKTIAFGSNTLTDVASLATSQTLTNKTINIANNTLTGVQSTLVSGTSIKTVNSTSLLGSGDIVTGGITLGTPVATTSGTSIDITGIPSGTKRITITIKGVSNSGSSRWIVQLGDSGGIETTGYASGVTITTTDNGDSSIGLVLGGASAALVMSGSMIITLQNSSTNSYTAIGVLADSTTIGAYPNAGSKSLSGVLDRIRLTTVAGIAAFDAGEVNLLLE